MSTGLAKPRDPYASILDQTDQHRVTHGCWAYPFRDGPALGVLAAAIGASRILELGTALGYSACWLAQGAASAQVDTIERDPIHADLARANLRAFGVAHRVRVIEGDFDEVLPTVQAGYDLAFIDGYAPSLQQLHQVRRLLRRRGVLITANLDLQGGHDARVALTQAKDWMSAPLLEGGRTMVSVACRV